MPRRPANTPAQAPRRSNRIAAGRVNKPTAQKATNARPLRIKAFQPNNKSKFKKTNNDEDDEESSPSPPPQPPAPPLPKDAKDDEKCNFCKYHPEGRSMDARQPCDWSRGRHNMECQNCSDYRSRNPGITHDCKYGSGSLKLHRNYGDNHPFVYPAPNVCERCATTGKSASCDVDALLGYSCSFCRGRNRCVLPSTSKVLDPRPNPRQGFKKWIRHACDSCLNLQLVRREATTVTCSWTSNRSQWQQSCARCAEKKMMCIDGAIIVHMPQQLFPPDNWNPYCWTNGGWAELRPNTHWRKACVHCTRDKAHCRAACNRPYSACNRCTQMGIDCVNADGTLYPLFDLSQVGFGNYMPFPKCARCTTMGRNCDRQRPCDSCTENGECDLCDKPEKSMKMKGNCLWGRLDPAPGPMYYLAMGYSAEGVKRVKRNHKIEHWVGPPVTYYGFDANRKNSRTLIRTGTRCREEMLPPAIPPHAIPGSMLALTPPSQLTVTHIADMIRLHWRGAYEPRRHNGFQKALNAAEQMIAGGLAAGNVEAEAVEGADAADPEPELDTQPGIQSHQPSQAAGAGNMAGDFAEEDVDASGEDVEITVAPTTVIRISRVQAQLPIGPPRPGAHAESPTDLPPITPSELSFDGHISPPPPPRNMIPPAHHLAQRPTDHPIQQSHDTQTIALPPAPTQDTFQGMPSNLRPAQDSPLTRYLAAANAGQVPDQSSMVLSTFNNNAILDNDVDMAMDGVDFANMTLDTPFNIGDENLQGSIQPQGFATEANLVSEDVQMTTFLDEFSMGGNTDFGLGMPYPQFVVDSGNQNLSNLPLEDPTLLDSAVYSPNQTFMSSALNNNQASETQPAAVASMSGMNPSGGASSVMFPQLDTLNSGFNGNDFNLGFQQANPLFVVTPQQMMSPMPPMPQAQQQNAFTNYTNTGFQPSVQPPAQNQLTNNTNTFFQPMGQTQELPQAQGASTYLSLPQSQPQSQPQMPHAFNSNNALQHVPQQQSQAQYQAQSQAQYQPQSQFQVDFNGLAVDSAVNTTVSTQLANTQLANTQLANTQINSYADFYSNIPNQASLPAPAPETSTTANTGPLDFTQVNTLLLGNTYLDQSWILPQPQSSTSTSNPWQASMPPVGSQLSFQGFPQTQTQRMQPVPDDQRSPVAKPGDDNYVKRRWRLMNKYHPNERDKILAAIGRARRRKKETLRYKIFGRVLEEGIERDLTRVNPLRNVLGTMPDVDEDGAIVEIMAPGTNYNNSSSNNNNNNGNAGVGSSSGNNFGAANNMMGSFQVSTSHHTVQNTTTNNNFTNFINTSSDNFTNISSGNSQPQPVRRCGECLVDTTIDCGRAVTLDHKCISLEHDYSSEEPPYVCDACAQHTRAVLVDPNFKAISSGELRRLRAYLCDECSVSYGDPRKMSRLHRVGFNTVWGLGDSDERSYTADGSSLEYFARRLPLTGCSCGVKMLRGHVCKFHRYENAERALHFANRARVWRLQRFGREICPACLLTKSATAANVATDMPPPIDDVPQHDPTSHMRSWACFACSGWVMNQLNRPKLVPGWRTWFSWNPASLDEKDNTEITPDNDNAQ